MNYHGPYIQIVEGSQVLNFTEVVLIHAMREVKKEVILTGDFKPDATSYNVVMAVMVIVILMMVLVVVMLTLPVSNIHDPKFDLKIETWSREAIHKVTKHFVGT